MAGHIDDVVDAAKNAVIAVRGKHGAIRSVIWPILPIFALRILVVLFVVLTHEALRIAPDGLHDSGPGIANANIPGGARASGHFLTFFIPDDGVNAERGRPCAARLHGVERGLSRTEEATCF